MYYSIFMHEIYAMKLISLNKNLKNDIISCSGHLVMLKLPMAHLSTEDQFLFLAPDSNFLLTQSGKQ